MYAAIPPRAQRFLQRNIASIGQLEVFLLLAANPHQWWTCDAVNEELRGSTTAVRQALRRLVSAYLVEFKGVGRDAVFRFCPSDPSIHSLIPLLAQLFRSRLSALVEFVHGAECSSRSRSDSQYYRRKPGPGSRDEASPSSAGES
jgi:hypothetical protein